MLLTRHSLPLADDRPDTDDMLPAPASPTDLPAPPPGIAATRWSNALNRVTGLVAPRHAARKALSRFDAETAFAGLPALDGGDGMQQDVLSLRGRRIRLMRWGDPQNQPYVLIPPQDAAHADAMAPWIDVLRDAGFAVVAFAREHARQGPRTSTWLDLANDMLEVGRRCGEAAAVVGHSLGAMSVAVALHQGLRAKRAILISAQADPHAALERFVSRTGIGSRAGACVRDLLEARMGQTLEALQAHRLASAIGIPVLVVHDLLDDEVPWHEGERFARHLSAARLLTTLDLGHHGVLADPSVLHDCVRFLAGATVGDKVVSSQNLPYGFA
jgi:hypothetical protein